MPNFTLNELFKIKSSNSLELLLIQIETIKNISKNKEMFQDAENLKQKLMHTTIAEYLSIQNPKWE